MSPKVERPLPPYLQILQAIRSQIADGVLREGEPVPSERQISSDWGVSRATATKVLAALRSEGLVQSVQGVGTIVSPQPPVGTSAQDRFTTMRRTGRIYAPGEHAKIVTATLVEASEAIASALGVELGAPVIERQRVTYQGDDAVSASHSWFDGALADDAPKLLLTERLVEGTPGYIQSTTGRTACRGRDQVTGRAATQVDAERLGVPEGAPVRAGRNWLYDTEGGVIEYGESVSLAGRWASYEYDISN
ncbi:GntR family transcriptional regulator [Streptomyces benahoarensis]|uniref:GntR family transcriptional regulator n=1 Tax=Streptomyces benahoarensis TaxID=2595054 RepID=A0A553Z788_9ACTN|nr:GntR family transcriptional regulator [Streptomyces benahoarensis]TSB24018.1 GntR family transcriptional regulator [Streptomyces benahoarensis]TSB37293.1 GntR family transcriptional regulator [Streptomyces benahoarensis]